MKSPRTSDSEEAFERFRLKASAIEREIVPNERLLATDALHDWGTDMLELNERTQGHALLFYGLELFRHHDLFAAANLEEKTLAAFLVAMEEGYGNKVSHPGIPRGSTLVFTLTCEKVLTPGRAQLQQLWHELLQSLLLRAWLCLVVLVRFESILAVVYVLG